MTGHTYNVDSLTLLLNSDLASGAWDNTIKIWNPTDGTLKQTLIGHSDWIRGLRTLPNGDLASGLYDETIKQ